MVLLSECEDVADDASRDEQDSEDDLLLGRHDQTIAPTTTKVNRAR